MCITTCKKKIAYQTTNQFILTICVRFGADVRAVERFTVCVRVWVCFPINYKFAWSVTYTENVHLVPFCIWSLFITFFSFQYCCCCCSFMSWLHRNISSKNSVSFGIDFKIKKQEIDREIYLHYHKMYEVDVCYSWKIYS